MEDTTGDKRRKLTDEDRKGIHERFFARLKTSETVSSIADHFGITRQWVRRVAREVEAERK